MIPAAWDEIVAFIAALSLPVLGWLAWWRTREVDENVEEKAALARDNARIEQIVTGQDGLIKALQAELTRLYKKVDWLEEEIRALRREREGGTIPADRR